MLDRWNNAVCNATMDVSVTRSGVSQSMDVSEHGTFGVLETTWVHQLDRESYCMINGEKI